MMYRCCKIKWDIDDKSVPGLPKEHVVEMPWEEF